MASEASPMEIGEMREEKEKEKRRRVWKRDSP